MPAACTALLSAIVEFEKRFYRKPERIRIGEDFRSLLMLELEPHLNYGVPPAPGAPSTFAGYPLIVDPDAPITAFTVECAYPLLTLLCTYPPMPARLQHQTHFNGPVFFVEGAADDEYWISDAVSFEGVESINPTTGKPTGHELRLPVSGYSRDQGVLVTAFPLIPEGMYRNASKLPAAGARITNHSRRRE